MDDTRRAMRNPWQPLLHPKRTHDLRQFDLCFLPRLRIFRALLRSGSPTSCVCTRLLPAARVGTVGPVQGLVVFLPEFLQCGTLSTCGEAVAVLVLVLVVRQQVDRMGTVILEILAQMRRSGHGDVPDSASVPGPRALASSAASVSM